MKSIHILVVCTILSLMVLTIGCATPPREEMENATEAVTRAENDADAVAYANNSIVRAQEALRRMHTEADSKRYDAAKSYAAEAIAAAERAISDGQAGAARAREEAANLVFQLRPLIVETEQGISAARAGELPLDFESLDNEFNSAVINADSAQIAFSNSRYQDAMNRGRAARVELNNINQQLSNVVIATTRKK